MQHSPDVQPLSSFDICSGVGSGAFARAGGIVDRCVGHEDIAPVADRAGRLDSVPVDVAEAAVAIDELDYTAMADRSISAMGLPVAQVVRVLRRRFELSEPGDRAWVSAPDSEWTAYDRLRCRT